MFVLSNVINKNVVDQVVGNSLKSLEVSEEKANQRVEEFKKQLKTLTSKLKEAEARAEYAEKTVKKLQKEVDRLEGMTLTANLPLLVTNKIKFKISLRDITKKDLSKLQLNNLSFKRTINEVYLMIK